MKKTYIKYITTLSDISGLSKKLEPLHTYEIIGGLQDYYSIWAAGTLVFVPKELENIQYTIFQKPIDPDTTYYERS